MQGLCLSVYTKVFAFLTDFYTLIACHHYRLGEFRQSETTENLKLIERCSFIEPPLLLSKARLQRWALELLKKNHLLDFRQHVLLNLTLFHLREIDILENLQSNQYVQELTIF